VHQHRPLAAIDWFTYVASPLRTPSGFTANTLLATDNGSAGPVPLGFTLNFYGLSYSTAYVNNNGTVTFNAALATGTPFNLTTSTIPIIAAFFADVDTRISPVVTYGRDFIQGRPAFAVNWAHVGYYNQHTDKSNVFQLVLIDRGDVAAGAFDIEFNYSRVRWETGDASGGTGGLGGTSARVSYANGSGPPGTFTELAGSGINGAFLDNNPTTGLIHHSLNSPVLGRYRFPIRLGGGGGGGGGSFAPPPGSGNSGGDGADGAEGNPAPRRGRGDAGNSALLVWPFQLRPGAAGDGNGFAADRSAPHAGDRGHRSTAAVVSAIVGGEPTRSLAAFPDRTRPDPRTSDAVFALLAEDVEAGLTSLERWS
jgi:hypothetical protein